MCKTTIEENIRLGKLNSTDAEIKKAVELANASDLIMSYENEYDTNIDELTEGEKLRIVLARALIRDPKILLVDESFKNEKPAEKESKPDKSEDEQEKSSNSEVIVDDYEDDDEDDAEQTKEAFNRAKKGRTTIIFSNDLETIESADQIAIFKNGEMKVAGHHKELIEKNVFYINFVKKILNKESAKEGNNDDGEEK